MAELKSLAMQIREEHDEAVTAFAKLGPPDYARLTVHLIDLMMDGRSLEGDCVLCAQAIGVWLFAKEEPK